MEIEQLITICESELKEKFDALENTSAKNTEKVLDAFRKNRLQLRHFNNSTGYGYGDDGRDTLNAVYADVFGCESAIVSPNITCGTHAITLALYAVLRPFDTLLSITGNPYDTLMDTILGEGNGSLKDFKVNFEKFDLINGKIDFTSVEKRLKGATDVKMVYIQRSRGYDWRNSLSIDGIEEICKFVRGTGFKGCIFVDNCYGEFVNVKEPTAVGADLCAGSLIKNPGGGIVPTGGYLAGKKEYVDLVSNRLTSPSLGAEVGSYAYGYQLFYQGLFLAPHTVKEALKTNLLFGKCMDKLGYKTSPCTDEMPCDITRSIMFDSEKSLTDFIQSIQNASPVDNFVTLEAWDMPGYDHKVIMAAGCFVQGSSIELSADAPIKEPYICYMQGGLTYEHGKIALKSVLKNLMK